MNQVIRVGSVLALGLLLAACASRKQEPAIASSSNQASYAQQYPEALEAEVKDFSEREQEVKTAMGEMSQYPSALKDPDWTHVGEIYDRADQAGRSYAYVEQARETKGVQTFFEEEKTDITKKVGGSVQYAASQKGCNVDAYGAVSHSLGEAVNKQLEKRLRERNEAHLVIDRYKTSLGKENVATLETQADKIAYSSYIANIYMVEQKQKLKRQVEEAEGIRKTADDFIEAEHAFQNEPGRTDAEKKDSEARIEAMNRSKGNLDSAVTQTKSMQEKLDERITSFQKEYASTIDSLKKDVSSRGGNKK